MDCGETNPNELAEPRDPWSVTPSDKHLRSRPSGPRDCHNVLFVWRGALPANSIAMLTVLDRTRSIVHSGCMPSNATGPQPRRPLPPSARKTGKTGATEPTGRSARRTSNRPPARPFFSVPTGTAARQAPDTSAKPKAAAATASSSLRGSPALTSEVRDDLVRALMPDLRILTEQLVKSTVDRSIAPLLNRQRALEAKLEGSSRSSPDKPHDFEAAIAAALAPLLAKQRELEKMLATSRHAEVHSQPSPGTGAAKVPDLPSSSTRPAIEEPVAASRARPPPLPVQAAPQPPPLTMAVERPAIAPRSNALAPAAFDTNALVDIPAELNGSRRKRLVVFLLIVVLVGILATVASLSVMSNMGAYP